jgi:hypothetical protein
MANGFVPTVISATTVLVAVSIIEIDRDVKLVTKAKDPIELPPYSVDTPTAGATGVAHTSKSATWFRSRWLAEPN